MALRSKKTATALLIISVAIFLAIYFSGNDAKSKAELSTDIANISESKTVDDLSGAAGRIDSTGKKTNLAQSSYVLPSIDKPIDETFGELMQAANNGEAKARCRLGIEAVKCQLLLQQDEKQINEMADSFHAHTWPENQNFADEAAIATLKSYKACKNLSKDQLKSTEALLEQAAKQKQLDAMVVWASGIWIEARYGNSTQYLQDPAFNRWRASAMPTMNEALRRGSIDAAIEWATAYKFDTGGLFRGLVPNDPKRSHTFYLLTGLILNKPRNSNGLSPLEIQSSENEAQQMFRDWFGGKVTTEDELTGPMGSITMGGEDQHDFCNSPSR